MKTTNRQPNLPEPSCCDNCNSKNITFEFNSIVYGKQLGQWPYCWFCHDCRAMVGVHPRSKTPLGKMATSFVRRLRAQAHVVFDPLWKEKFMSRDRAYNWLADQLGIQRETCHIGWMTAEQLKLAMKIVTEYLNENREALARRRDKRHAKRQAAGKHLSNRIRARKNQS